MRAYLMFFARWDMGAPWSYSGIDGTFRWVKRVWNLVTDPDTRVGASAENSPDLRSLRRKVHQTLQRVTHDFDTFEFNTIVSSLMELLNEMYRFRDQGAGGSPEWSEAIDIYLRMMAPVTPHVAEELWAYLGKPYSIHTCEWPTVDKAAAADEEITLVVQVNGKVRDRLTVPAGTGDEQVKNQALASPAVQKFLEGRPPRKVIVVPGRLVNIVG